MDTNVGKFANYATLRLAYLDAHQGRPPVEKFLREEPWHEDRLHISKLGACPRQQMLMLLGTEKRKKNLLTRANEELMYWQGNMIHALTAGAMAWAGILVSFEEPLPNMPEGWTGHYDCVWFDMENGEHVCWDGKSVRPNAFDYAYTWPKDKDALQMGGYLHHLENVDRGEIEYIDRGGSNTPQVFLIAVGGKYVEAVPERMALLDAYRAQLPELPPVLSPVYTPSYWKVRGEPVHRLTGVKYGVSWECEWCDYLYGKQDKKTKVWTVDSDSPCKPDMTQPDFVAKQKDGRWRVEPEHEAGVESFLLGVEPEWWDSEDET